MVLRVLVLLWPVALAAQSTFPTIIGRSLTMLPPAVDRSGQKVVLGSAIAPDGTGFTTTDLYIVMADGSGLRRLTRLSGGLPPPQGADAVSLSPDGARAAFTVLDPNRAPRGEEVHVVEVATGADRTVAVDTGGCIQPLVACPNCFFPCVAAPHISPDGSKVLYVVRRQQPFYVANADGAGLTHLPTFSGNLAAAPQRVISRGGSVVFTSSAPSGPTFAASATDVYLMNLDGTNLRQVTKFGNDPSVSAFNAVISADGSVITFDSNRDPDTGAASRSQRVWMVRADGSGLRPLTSAGDSFSQPSISGDGSQVAFVQNGQIYLVRSDGTGLKQLTNFKMSTAQDAVISEDGSLVALTIQPQNPSLGSTAGAIYAVNADGSNLRPVYAPRSLNQGGITGLIGFSSPSPGSLISAYGTNLTGDALVTATRFPLPDTLAGLSLLVNGRPVPLLAVTPWQVNAQLPPEMSEGPAAFQLRFAGGAMPTPAAADVKGLAPAIFSSLPPAGGYCQAAVLHGNSGVIVDDAHPADAGEAIEIYGGGLGLTNPFVPAGVPAPISPLAQTFFRPEVLIGGKPAAVLFAGLTPGLAGVYQVNAIVPSGLRPGRQAVAWRAGTLSNSGCGTIVVK